MGSQNMIDSSYLLLGNLKVWRHWKDLSIKISGEIVLELEAVFAMDWYTETGERLDAELEFVSDPEGNDVPIQLVLSGPGYLKMPNLRLFTGLVHRAQQRSFGLDYEITLMSTGQQFVADLQKVADEYRSVCRELTLAEWSSRPRGQRYVDNVMRLVSALL
jgi:phosphatidylserine/phosphatidylglycerophosphate/cardiolipin synthase-like enzyme